MIANLEEEGITLSGLPIASLACILRNRGFQLDKIERDHLIKLLRFSLEKGLCKYYVFDRLPPTSDSPPRCWATAVLHRKYTAHDIYLFGGRDMGRYGEDACDSLYRWESGDMSPDSWRLLELNSNSKTNPTTKINPQRSMIARRQEEQKAKSLSNTPQGNSGMLQGARGKGNNHPDVPKARWAHISEIWEGRLYVFGGQDYDGGRNNEMFMTDLTQDNQDKRKWMKVDWYGDLPSPRSGHTSCLDCLEKDGSGDGELWVFGGVDEDDDAMSDLFVFNLRTRTWREMLPIGILSAGGEDTHLHIVRDWEKKERKAYLIVGIDRDDIFCHTMKVFCLQLPWASPTMNNLSTAWKELKIKGPAPPSRSDLATCWVAGPGGQGCLVHAGLHARSGQVLNDLYKLNLDRMEWERLDTLARGQLGAPRAGHRLLVGSGGHDHQVYIIGGHGNEEQNPITQVDRLSLPHTATPRLDVTDSGPSCMLFLEHLDDTDIQDLADHWKVDEAEEEVRWREELGDDEQINEDDEDSVREPPSRRSLQLSGVKRRVRAWLADQWVVSDAESLSPAPARCDFAAAASEHQVFMFGGRNTMTSKEELMNSLNVWGSAPKDNNLSHIQVGLSGGDGWDVESGSGAPPRKGWGASMVYHLGRLYVFGGRNLNNAFNKLMSYSIKSQNWVDCYTEGSSGTAPVPRSGAGLAVWDEGEQNISQGARLVMFGGASEFGDALVDVHIFHLSTGAWEEVKVLPEDGEGTAPPGGTESGCHVAVVEGVLHVLVSERRGLAIYTLPLDQPKSRWSRLYPRTNFTPSHRTGFAACTFKHLWVVFGGRVGMRKLSELLIFNFHSREWTQITPHSNGKSQLPGRSEHSLVCFNDMLMLIGGRGESSSAETTVYSIHPPMKVLEQHKQYQVEEAKRREKRIKDEKQRRKAERQQNEYQAAKLKQKYGWDDSAMIGASIFEPDDKDEAFTLDSD